MRRSLNCFIAVVASASIIAPAHASPRRAAFGTSGDRAAVETGVFSGASVKLALDRTTGKRTAEVRLNLASHTIDRAGAPRSFGPGVELGVQNRGTPMLATAGQPVRLAASPDFEPDHKIIYLVAAAVVLVGVVLLLKKTGVPPPH